MRWGCIFIFTIAATHAHAGTLISPCTNGPIIQGIDVSDYQANTNWSIVGQTGIKFSFIKATEGISFLNRDFARDWIGADSNKIARSAYHFFVPKDDPTTQANFFLTNVGKLKPTDLAPMLDLEESSGLPASEVVARATTWLQVVKKATGKNPIIYTSPGFWNSLGNPEGFEQYPLFIVEFNVKCPKVPPPWKVWSFWQYQEGKLSGVSSLVDFDVFHGSEQQLLKLTK